MQKNKLRAGIASMFLGLEMGIGYEPSKINNSAVIDLLRNDENEIFRLALEGEKDLCPSFKNEPRTSIAGYQHVVKSERIGFEFFRGAAKVQKEYIAIGQKYFFLESPRDVAFGYG